eukprot:TRINITY_DN33270_c0_g1_i1.p1 TRINITY_DN33270_c0_g1~~TRINITY_DN33270_c0_g1_i1.p1  ORF type:complete len:1087 (-),score=251.64 TRINITY_DN33270_c0_g1_i1:473-3733(-)
MMMHSFIVALLWATAHGIHLNIGMGFPPIPGVIDATIRFASAINESSNGELTMSVFPIGTFPDPARPGSMIVDFETLWQTMNRTESGNMSDPTTLHVVHAASYYWADFLPEAQFFATVPFGMDVNVYNAWLHFGGGLEMWREIYAPYNAYPLPAANTLEQSGGWFDRPIRSLQDIVGMRMRIPGLAGEVVRRHGMTPVNVPTSDILPGFLRGDINAAEFISPPFDIRLGLANYSYQFRNRPANSTLRLWYYAPGWHELASGSEFTFNKGVWDALPAHLRALVAHAAGDADRHATTLAAHMNYAALQTLSEVYHTQMERFPDDLLAAFGRTAQVVLAEEAAHNPRFARVLDSYNAYRRVASQPTVRLSADEAHVDARGDRAAEVTLSLQVGLSQDVAGTVRVLHAPPGIEVGPSCLLSEAGCATPTTLLLTVADSDVVCGAAAGTMSVTLEGYSIITVQTTELVVMPVGVSSGCDGSSGSRAVLVMAVVISVVGVVVLVAGGALAYRMMRQRQAYLRVYGDHALAEQLTHAVMLWDLDALSRLRTIPHPSKLQKRFTAIADQLTVVRPYIPAAVLGILKETAEAFAGDLAESSQGSRTPRLGAVRVAATPSSVASSSRPGTADSRKDIAYAEPVDSFRRGSRVPRDHPSETLAAQTKGRLAAGLSLRLAVVAVVKIFGADALAHSGLYSYDALHAAVVGVALQSAGMSGVVEIGPDGLLVVTWNSATTCLSAADAALAFVATFGAAVRPILAAFSPSAGSGRGMVQVGSTSPVHRLCVGMGVVRQWMRTGNIGTTQRMQHVTIGAARVAEALARYAVAIEPATPFVALANHDVVVAAGPSHVSLLRGLVSWTHCLPPPPPSHAVEVATLPSESADGLSQLSGNGAGQAAAAANRLVRSLIPVYQSIGQLAVAAEEWMYQLEAVVKAREPIEAFNKTFAQAMGLQLASSGNSPPHALAMEPARDSIVVTAMTPGRAAAVRAVVDLSRQDLAVGFQGATVTADLTWLRNLVAAAGGETASPEAVAAALSRVVSFVNTDLPFGCVAAEVQDNAGGHDDAGGSVAVAGVMRPCSSGVAEVMEFRSDARSLS